MSLSTKYFIKVAGFSSTLIFRILQTVHATVDRGRPLLDVELIFLHLQREKRKKTHFDPGPQVGNRSDTVSLYVEGPRSAICSPSSRCVTPEKEALGKGEGQNVLCLEGDEGRGPTPRNIYFLLSDKVMPQAGHDLSACS